MSATKKYEMMILLTEEFNDSELKTWAFNYAKSLSKLSASEISVISRGKRDLAYDIKNQKKGHPKRHPKIEADIIWMIDVNKPQIDAKRMAKPRMFYI